MELYSCQRAQDEQEGVPRVDVKVFVIFHLSPHNQ